jgi:prolipoprotein diacylglyceryltransferase
VVAGALLFRPIWRCLQRACERIANSRRDWLFAGGRFRIISHALYSFVAGALGAGIVGYVTGYVFVGMALVVLGLAGAALYAQASWGSRALLRPFGFWGGAAGAAGGALVLWLTLGIPLPQLAVGVVLAAPYAQAAGRLRCLVQGCCHGIPTDGRFGIRVWQPQSRVCLLSGLRGEYILITQLYSILANLLLGGLLIAMWRWQTVPASLIVAAYFVLTSIERFAEDGYRGETQTRMILGLKEPQWIALGGLAAGVASALLPATYATADVAGPSVWLVVAALIGGLITAFAMSMDFPQSQVRFSRLSG